MLTFSFVNITHAKFLAFTVAVSDLQRRDAEYDDKRDLPLNIVRTADGFKYLCSACWDKEYENYQRRQRRQEEKKMKMKSKSLILSS
jgi:hypothetical protein